MSENFKTCMFGGFDKQDVVTYIEQQSKSHQEALEALQRDNDTLQEAVQRLERERGELLPKAQRQEQGVLRIRELEAQLTGLQEELTALRQENESLRVPAAEYQSLRDHIAEIEITAHRRTEEFRAEAIRKIRDIIAVQRDWCSEERQRYGEMNGEILEKLRQATAVMESSDEGAFDRMMESLQQLEDGLE